MRHKTATKIATFVAIAIANTLVHANGETVKENRISLPAQPLAQAIQSIAQQTNLNILIDPKLVRGRQSPQLTNVALDEALMMLLAGTGLTTKTIDERTITVIAAKPIALNTNSAALDTGTFDTGALRVAQSTSSAGDTNESARANTQDSKEAQEILVTGTHIRGVQGLATPSITFTRKDIENSGFTELDELFQSLPQNLDEISADAQIADGTSLVARSNLYASGISLRGLGPGSTLVLLNGKRRAGSVDGRVVDINAIPLSAIEHVEVVTGGRSAVYGSDAVAGVVNLVTRRGFEGGETQLQYGGASAGGERLQVSQLYGAEFSRGGFIASYDYSRSHTLDIVDIGITHSTGSGIVLERYDIRPQVERHSGFVSGQWDLSERVQLYIDGMYTSLGTDAGLRYSFGTNFTHQFTDMSSDQYSVAPGVLIELGSWTLDLSGSHSLADTTADSDLAASGTAFLLSSNSESILSSVSALMEGPLFALSGREVRAAFGVERRSESLENRTDGVLEEDRDRAIQSAFAELLVPLSVGEQRLELSLAGRYDDYDDFGDTFNPQFGVVWASGEQWTWRAAYADAFRAPDLFSLASRGSIVLRNLVDPTRGPTATSPTLLASGGNPNLQPEEASTWSVGFDYKPQFAPWGRMSLAYVEIDYQGRIDQPALAFANQIRALRDEQLYPGLIDRTPSSAEMQAIVAAATSVGNVTGVPFNRATQDVTVVFPNLVFFDNRLNNIGREKVAAIDLNLDSEFQTRVGELSFGLNATYSREHERQVTVISPSLSLLNEPGKPTDLRFRANMGWQRSVWGAFLYVNYVDRYTDTIAIPQTKVASWTTADLTLRLNTGELVDGGMFDDMNISLAIDNVLDRDPPPFLSNSFGFGYDAVNSDAIGRYLSLRLIKRWN